MDDDALIASALAVLQGRLEADALLPSSDNAKSFFKLKLSHYDREVFAIMVLNTRHHILEYKELFFGTIDRSCVYPREVARRALSLNGAAVVLAHNHPSGVPEPSQSDIQITDRIRTSLELFDIRTLDHIIVAGDRAVSLAERGVI